MQEGTIQQVWCNFPEGGARLTLMLAIATLSDGGCEMSTLQLAKIARMSGTNVWRLLGILEHQNWITQDPSMQRGMHLITINLAKLGSSAGLITVAASKETLVARASRNPARERRRGAAVQQQLGLFDIVADPIAEPAASSEGQGGPAEETRLAQRIEEESRPTEEQEDLWRYQIDARIRLLAGERYRPTPPWGHPQQPSGIGRRRQPW